MEFPGFRRAESELAPRTDPNEFKRKSKQIMRRNVKIGKYGQKFPEAMIAYGVAEAGSR